VEHYTNQERYIPSMTRSGDNCLQTVQIWLTLIQDPHYSESALLDHSH